MFIHRSTLQLLSKLWSWKLLNHNEAAIDLQIEPSSINMQEWDTPVTAMFYHFRVPEGGTLHGRKIALKKKYQNTRSFL